jgi:hypothetical protein
MRGTILPLPQYAFMAWCSVKTQGQLYLLLLPLPELDRLLQLKQRLRKLWQETRDPECKTAVNWVTKTIHRMTRKKTLERLDTRLGNCEVIPQAIWPIARTLLNRDAPRAPTTVHGCSGLKFLPKDKANAIVDCSENHLTHHDLCDEHHERRVKASVQALLETEDSSPLGNNYIMWPGKTNKIIES